VRRNRNEKRARARERERVERRKTHAVREGDGERETGGGIIRRERERERERETTRRDVSQRGHRRRDFRFVSWQAAMLASTSGSEDEHACVHAPSAEKQRSPVPSGPLPRVPAIHRRDDATLHRASVSFAKATRDGARSMNERERQRERERGACAREARAAAESQGGARETADAPTQTDGRAADK